MSACQSEEGAGPASRAAERSRTWCIGRASQTRWTAGWRRPRPSDADAPSATAMAPCLVVSVGAGHV
eukprot:1497944-Prymnesium_polylepis.1